MAAVAKPIVIDASVALAWLLPDEHTSLAANTLYERATKGEVSFTAPQLLLYEVLNGLRSAIIQKRLPTKLLPQAVAQFLQLDIAIHPQTDTSLDIVNQALKLNISVYDAAYSTLAQTLSTSLYTTDTKLADKISPQVKINRLY